MRSYSLKIQTPEKTVYSGEVTLITVSCGQSDRFSVLAGHAPMVVRLTEGQFVVQNEQETLTGTTGHGFLQVKGNEAVVMVHSFGWNDDTAEDAEEETAEPEAAEG